uniref:UBC core domain-containing protein n=1 Tax=Hyaloperonospora arabidopsidis (strain Emoy2) TaxID=559515 RepID=M4BL78_HYAAE
MYMRSDFAALRVRKDVNELSKAKFTCSQAKTRVDFPDGADNMLQLIFTISIADVSEIPRTYPFHAPSVTCLTRVWHPNIDMATGKVMMSILGKDWCPVLSINTVLLGLQNLASITFSTRRQPSSCMRTQTSSEVRRSKYFVVENSTAWTSLRIRDRLRVDDETGGCE